MKHADNAPGTVGSTAPGAVVTAELVSETLARRGLRLRFPPALEARLERDIGPARCRLLIWRGLVSLIVMNSFLLVDRTTIPDAFHLSALLRLGVITPLALLTIIVLVRNAPPLIREGTQAGLSILAAGSIMLLTVVTESPAQSHFPFGVILVILFASAVQVLRFGYLVAVCGAVVAMTFCGIAQLDAPAQTEMALLPGLVIAAAMLGCLSGYSLERESRLAYLNGLLMTLYAEKLEALALSDPLTGAGNRRALEVRFGALVLKKGPQTRIAVVLVDIDFFKQYNDTFGHGAGDDCLRRVAQALGGTLRAASDQMFRFGGEEFLALLADATEEEAAAVAERMRAAVAATAIPHSAPLPGSVVTASFGVAGGVGESAAELKPLVLAADMALYEAKRSGRNRVRTASGGGPDLPAPHTPRNIAA